MDGKCVCPLSPLIEPLAFGPDLDNQPHGPAHCARPPIGSRMVWGLLEMFVLGSLTDDRIRRILEAHRHSPFSYSNQGATRTLLPAEYEVRRDQFLLGEGSRVFFKAKEAVRKWRMFDIAWLRLYWSKTPVAAGNSIAVAIGWFGIWMVNVCRIVYVIDEPRRYGFAYGTLSQHAEAGEELFLVEWRDDDSVWYEVLAFSRERHPLVKIAYPIARRLQKKFRSDSGAAMQKASVVEDTGALRSS